jgi:hypothetical protein
MVEPFKPTQGDLREKHRDLSVILENEVALRIDLWRPLTRGSPTRASALRRRTY